MSLCRSCKCVCCNNYIFHEETCMFLVEEKRWSLSYSWERVSPNKKNNELLAFIY